LLDVKRLPDPVASVAAGAEVADKRAAA